MRDDRWGTRGLAVTGGGYGAGLLASLALAGPWALVLPATYVPGWPAAPAFLGPLGYAVAAGCGVGAGYVAGRPAAGPWGAATAAGAIAGFLVYAIVGAPALAIVSAAPLWDAAVVPHDELAGKAMLAIAVPTVVGFQFVGCAGLVALFAALGALGGALAVATRESTPLPLDARPLTAMASSGTSGAITLGLTAVAFMIGMDELYTNVESELATHAARALAPAAMVYAPVGMFLASQGLVSLLGAASARQSWRHAVKGRSVAGFQVLVGVALAVGVAVLGVPLTSSGVWRAALLVAILTTTWLYAAALRAPVEAVQGPPLPETARESVAAGLTDTLAMLNPFVVCALQAGLALALGVVTWISPTMASGSAPDRAETAMETYQTMAGVLAGALVVLPVGMTLAHLVGAAIARRRSGVATVG